MDSEISEKEIIDILSKNSLFAGLTRRQLGEVVKRASVRVITKKGDIILYEGEISREMYIILKGSVRVLKREEEAEESLQITILSQGDCFGELSLFDEGIRSATIEATEHTVLLSILTTDILKRATQNRSFLTFIMNLSRELARRLRNTDEITVKALRRDLEQEKIRASMGNFIIYVIFILCFYTISLAIVYEITKSIKIENTTILSAPLILIFSGALFVLMLKDRNPLSFFGFNLKNWKRNLIEALWWSVLFIIVLTIFKWSVVQFVPAFQNIPVIDFSDLVGGSDGQGASGMVLLGIIYLAIICPVQEMSVRGALQSSFQGFYINKRTGTFWAIILSNAIFSTAHAHLSPLFSALVFIPGIFWGIMYARQKSLLGVILSHILIGGWACFGLAFTKIFAF